MREKIQDQLRAEGDQLKVQILEQWNIESDEKQTWKFLQDTETIGMTRKIWKRMKWNFWKRRIQ